MYELIALEDTAKVWIYQADRVISYDEIDELRPAIFDFIDQWASHGSSLKAYGNVFHRQFIAFFVDDSEQGSGASGCSIDSSVAFVKQVGEEFGIDFFDRTKFTYMIDEEIYTTDMSSLKSDYASGKITDESLMFDNLVKTKKDFLQNWLKPLSESWHKQFL